MEGGPQGVSPGSVVQKVVLGQESGYRVYQQVIDFVRVYQQVIDFVRVFQQVIDFVRVYQQVIDFVRVYQQVIDFVRVYQQVIDFVRVYQQVIDFVRVYQQVIDFVPSRVLFDAASQTRELLQAWSCLCVVYDSWCEQRQKEESVIDA